jgi:hypothetical protein
MEAVQCGSDVLQPQNGPKVIRLPLVAQNGPKRITLDRRLQSRLNVIHRGFVLGSGINVLQSARGKKIETMYYNECPNPEKFRY